MSSSRSDVFTTGLAIFSMLFGAGNLIYPLLVGMTAGNLTFFGMIGFLITAVLLPLLGLITMILFDGNYEAFFHRLGTIPGSLSIFVSMLIIGPGMAIPRITTLSHTMIAPFLPFSFLKTDHHYSSVLFALIFLGITFLATYKENKIIDILGKCISPILLGSLFLIIVKGMVSAESVVPATGSILTIFTQNFIRGYETLDLLGAIFFASIVITILKKRTGNFYTHHELALIGCKSGLIGIFLLSLVYGGMSILSMYHSHGLYYLNAGQLFQTLSFKVLGSYGALVMSIAVLMACLSTAIALSVVVAEYIQHTIFKSNISYLSALIITLLLSLPLSVAGLDQVLALTGGSILYVGYPLLITLTLCNLAYKLYGFKPVKIPVIIVGLIVYILRNV